MNQVKLFIADQGIRLVDGKPRRTQPMKFEARLYSESGNGTYFVGRGKSAGEAMGNLVFKCKEMFNTNTEIIEPPE